MQSYSERPDPSLLLAPKISQMLEQRHTHEARATLAELAMPEIVDLLVAIEPQHRAIAFRLLAREMAADAFTELPAQIQQRLMDELTNEQLAQLFNEMDPDDRAELFDEMPGQLVTQLLAMMRPEERRSTRAILGYPADSVGRLMTPEFLALKPDWTIQQGLDHIRQHGRDAETVDILYVVDKHGRLLDDIRIRELLLTDLATKIESLMDNSAVWLDAHDDREAAVRVMDRYDISVLPVVDRDHVLVGIVTFDDIADVAEEETTEDIHKGAAVAPLEMSYGETSASALFRKRIPWLLVLVFINLGSSSVIEFFEETLQSMIALAFFIPLLIDTGGNTGSQSATIMVRAIATGDLELKQWLRTVGKELSVGITLGVAMGVAGGMLGLIRSGWELGLIVGLSMVCIVITTNLVGASLPFILSKLHIDPAVASSPLITSIADITGLIIYFMFANWLIGSLPTGTALDEVTAAVDTTLSCVPCWLTMT
ncbi:magnesium transporter [Nitrosomonas sp. ANs5]|uniref:magnesium transporter n=1 Tax=Nitrosomonas sp. ANs5 TaxID=3423941 RepID=UPI003D32ADCB